MDLIFPLTCDRHRERTNDVHSGSCPLSSSQLREGLGKEAQAPSPGPQLQVRTWHLSQGGVSDASHGAAASPVLLGPAHCQRPGFQTPSPLRPTALPRAVAQGCSLLLLISHHDSCYHVLRS